MKNPLFLLIFLLAVVLLFTPGCDDDQAPSSETGVSGNDDDVLDDDDDNDASDDDDDYHSDDDDDDTTETWRYITDKGGGALIFHGCNLDGSAKQDSGLPNFTEQEVHTLSETWGFNFARYLIFWYKIEPEPGVYDDVYLDEVEQRLDWAHDAGLRVVLDMHQDVWGPGISDDWGGSDGAPEWATITDGWPHIPFSQIFGGWAFDYLSPAVMRAFDNFWDYENHPELQDHFAAMWQHVVTRFKDHPAILGYDPLNEPWQGTDIIRYKQFDETKYSDFNQRMIDAIREVDSDGWIFYEPCAFGPNQGVRAFLREFDDPREGENRLAYFPHLYPALIDLTGGYDPNIDHTLERWEEYRKLESEMQKAPLIAGEWAMLFWHDDENRNLWNDRTLRMMERITSGWAYWDCNWLRGDEELEYFKMVTSAYPRRVAGYPTSYGYDHETKVLALQFEQRSSVSGATEIFIPADRDYPGGWELVVSDPDGSWDSEWNETTGILKVWTDPSQEQHTITVSPAL